MRAVSLLIEYDGTNFHGWQEQKDKRTVQGELRRAVSRISEGDFRIVGCCRTDAGVHALNYLCSIYYTKLKVEPKKLDRALNGILPEDVFVKSVFETSIAFNPRYHVRSKTYMYRILKYPSPIYRNFGYFHPEKLELRTLNLKAELFVGKRDFTHISAKSERKGECHVYASYWKEDEISYTYFVQADRFLYKMVRSMVGLMLRYSADEIKEILSGKPFQPFMVPSKGLFLFNIDF